MSSINISVEDLTWCWSCLWRGSSQLHSESAGPRWWMLPGMWTWEQSHCNGPTPSPEYQTYRTHTHINSLAMLLENSVTVRFNLMLPWSQHISAAFYKKKNQIAEHVKMDIYHFYRCTVHFEIYTVHSPTNALFINLVKSFKFTLKYTIISFLPVSVFNDHHQGALSVPD